VVEMSSAGEEHALLADHFLRRGVNRVVRNRIPPGGIFDLKHIDGYAGRVDFDTLLELEFTSDGQLRSFLGKSNELGASLMKVFEHPRLGSKITGFVARPPGASDDDFAL